MYGWLRSAVSLATGAPTFSPIRTTGRSLVKRVPSPSPMYSPRKQELDVNAMREELEAKGLRYE